MKIKKICFINPPTTRENYCIYFPMGPLVLATILKEQGIKAEILDFDLAIRQKPQLRNNYEEFLKYFEEQILSSGADAFGFSSICSNFATSLCLAESVSEWLPKAKILFGGPQPSSVPLKTLQIFPFIDAIVVGEGERTLLELLQSDWKEDSLQSVPGIAYRHRNQVKITPARSLIEDLDELPFPDFSLLPLRDYLFYTPYAAILEAGRGCPFSCNFCSTAEFWSRKYRAKSPARILEEMRRLHREFGLTAFEITHDNFTTSPKYVRQFCKYFIENNHEGFQWGSSARTDTLKVEDMKTLRQAGCTGLFLGVDSGSARIQNYIDKHLDLEGFKTILKEAVSLGIQVKASFIIGFPDENKSELDETIRLGMWAKLHGAGEVDFHRLVPLAGTKIYHENLPRLFFNPGASDMSFQIMDSPEIWNLMKRHPDLFSSYFSIPTPHLEPLELFQFADFYTTLVNRIGPGLKWLFFRDKKRPTALFEEWRQFSPRHFPQGEQLVDSFNEFL